MTTTLLDEAPARVYATTETKKRAGKNKYTYGTVCVRNKKLNDHEGKKVLVTVVLAEEEGGEVEKN